jgi:hypothetical protein
MEVDNLIIYRFKSNGTFSHLEESNATLRLSCDCDKRATHVSLFLSQLVTGHKLRFFSRSTQTNQLPNHI